jgi:cysteine desulfurase
MACAMRAGLGNPASAHSAGGQSLRIVESSRDAVCGLIGGADPEDVVFLAGGIEANNLALSAGCDSGAVFLAAPVEHASILKPLAQAAQRANYARC